MKAMVASVYPGKQNTLYSIAYGSDDHTVLMGGQDKTVYVYDARTWKIRSRWRCPLKYEIIGLQHSTSEKNACYAVGLDNEVICGDYVSIKKSKAHTMLQQNHRLGFRGDSKWTGISLTCGKDSKDQIVACCESGHLYTVTSASCMR